MRICIQISTGKLLEMQSDGSEGTLIKNQVGFGFEADDLEEREVTPAEYHAMLPPAEEQVSPLKALLADPASLAEIKKALGL